MINIILDRFLYVWLNLKYSFYINNRSLAAIIISHWSGSAILALIVTLLLQMKTIHILTYLHVSSYVIITLDLLIFIGAIITYAYLFVKIKVLMKNPLFVKRERATFGEIADVWWKLKVPTLMVFSFIIFNVSGTVIRTINTYVTFKMELYIANGLLDISGWFADALIYILLQKRVRSLLLRLCRKMKRDEFNVVETTEVKTQLYSYKSTHI